MVSRRVLVSSHGPPRVCIRPRHVKRARHPGRAVVPHPQLAQQANLLGVAEAEDLVEALDQATSFEAWDRLRNDQRLGRPRARAVMERTVRALANELGNERK